MTRTQFLDSYVLPQVGNIKLNLVTRSDVRRTLLRVHQKGLSLSSVRLTRDEMSGVLGCAVDEEIIKDNPVTGVLKRLGIKDGHKERVLPLTTKQVCHFLAVCHSQPLEYHPFFLCGFRTGIRLGELLALKWSDIDWNHGYINVERSFKRGEVGKTKKTGKTRHVDLPDQFRGVLRGLQTRRKREALRTGLPEEIPWIFHKNDS